MAVARSIPASLKAPHVQFYPALSVSKRPEVALRKPGNVDHLKPGCRTAAPAGDGAHVGEMSLMGQLMHECSLPPCVRLACSGMSSVPNRGALAGLARDPGADEVLCPHCKLPMGDWGYAEDGDEQLLVHGECAAELVLQRVKQEEAARLEQEAELKTARRKKYGIGWKVKQIPDVIGHASLLGCKLEPSGMCCLTWQGTSQLVGVVPTADPSASVNLEYLSLALQVRRREGRDPLFSLDPKDMALLPSAEREDRWQLKRYEPKWLQGTSVGEVLFQADYYLKELSMGERPQPVVGMKSCADLTVEEGPEKTWCAREWFVINRAEVGLSEESVLFPNVKMGVEAREQIKGSEGLEDAPLTRADHPLVKYAKAFTQNFDLIAERRSVVFHLRELAKASLLAKFLVESRVNLDDCWFGLSGASEVTTCVQIPQLWNERCHSHIQVTDGKIADADRDYGIKVHGVYGGVDFGLDKIDAKPGAAVLAPTPAGLQATRLPAHARAGSIVIPQLIAGTAGPPQFTGPKGVDLNLDQFDVGETTRLDPRAPAGVWAGEEFVRGAFWSGIKSGQAVPAENDDEVLLKEIFNPHLCDRRDEGDLFTPPDSSFASVASLRDLVKAEKLVQEKRKGHFFSTDFDVNGAGPLFPASWTPAVCVAAGASAEASPWRTPQGGLLQARDDCAAEASALMETSAPVFDKSTEDGLRFRVYRAGGLDVRTTQEPGCDETVGRVFSVRRPERSCAVDKGWSTVRNDLIVKAIEYVEHACHEGCPAAQQCHFYVVFETDWGHSIVTEKTTDGTVHWERNPKDLESRNSLAKVIRAADSHSGQISVQDVKNYQTDEDRRSGSSASYVDCKSYAHGAYKLVSSVRGAQARVTEAEWTALSTRASQLRQRQKAGGGEETPSSSDESQGQELCNAGVDSAESTDESPERAWEKEWAQLTEREVGAAKELGITGARLWKRASWAAGPKGLELGGARWEKSWAQLTRSEAQAARQLGVTSADAWELGVSGAREKRGK